MRRLNTTRSFLGAAFLSGVIALATPTAAMRTDAEGHLPRRAHAPLIARDNLLMVAAGIWGGDHLRIEVTDSGARLEFDCAIGTISAPLLLDASNRFSVQGDFVRGHGGPVREDELPDVHPATYAGWVVNDTMSLTVVLTDAALPAMVFELVYGSPGRVVRCL